ncbi:MAG: DUF58 domain-containing protein [Firmicutes bacterium]|nr:DUF58 domain-containing protein [Bacillota bacterium]
MQQIKSSFVNPAGLAVLAALALLSAYLRIDVLFAVLAGAFLLCLISWLWTRTALRKLSIGTDRPDVCGFPGDDLPVRIKLSNSKLLPVVWLSAELPEADRGCVSSEGEAAAFSWVMGRQTLEWTEELKAVKRGVCSFGHVKASSGDGFGLSEDTKDLPLDGGLRVIVFPALKDVNVNCILSRLSELEVSRNGFYSDPTLVKNVREYSGSESFKDLNWRLLAKGGELLVNIKEKMDVRRACILVDLESFSVTEDPTAQSGGTVRYRVLEDELEHALSVAGSVAAELCSKGVLCSLAIPGYAVKGEEPVDTAARPGRVVRPDEGDPGTDTLLTALAEIEYQGGPAKLPLEWISGHYHQLGQIFCIALEKRRALDALELAQPLPVWYVLPSDDGSGRTIEETELLR